MDLGHIFGDQAILRQVGSIVVLRLVENASAMAGIAPHGAGVVAASLRDCTGNVAAPGMDGPTKGKISLNPAAAPRVSTNRQGVMARSRPIFQRSHMLLGPLRSQYPGKKNQNGHYTA
jgi:hypothetical protein